MGFAHPWGKFDHGGPVAASGNFDEAMNHAPSPPLQAVLP
jgi:hypothetical protein